MSVLTHLFGGWNQLERLYPDRAMESTKTYSGSSLYFGGSVFGSYRRCIDVTVGLRGLRIAARLLSCKHFLAPMFIPWRDVVRCEPSRLGLVGEAVKLWVQGWPHPVYLGRFLGRYGDVCGEIRRRWQSGQKEAQS